VCGEKDEAKKRYKEVAEKYEIIADPSSIFLKDNWRILQILWGMDLALSPRIEW
jgi:thioredoxin-related protein